MRGSSGACATRFFYSRLLFQLAERHVDRALAGLEVPLWEVPIIAAPVQEQKFYPVARFPVNHKAGHDLFLCGDAL